mgnify:CR=1 FL=1
MASRSGGLKADFDDLLATLRAYVKQETIGPLKGLGRYLGFGLAGTICFAVAEIFLVLGVVRVSQSTTSPKSLHAGSALSLGPSGNISEGTTSVDNSAAVGKLCVLPCAKVRVVQVGRTLRMTLLIDCGNI